MKNQILIKGSLLLILAVLIAACSCNSQTQEGSEEISKKELRESSKKELKGTISISGAFALYPMTARWVEEFHKIHPEVRINVSAGGAGKGMTDALSGMVDLGMFSRGITDVEKAKGVWWIAVTQDAVLPTINANSPFIENVKKIGFTRKDFIDCFITREIKTWDKWADGIALENLAMNVYTRSDACGAAQMWGEYLGENQEDLVGIGIYGDPGMADAVKNDLMGIGYNNVIYIYDIKSRMKHPGVEVIPMDINENGKIDQFEMMYDKLDEIMVAIKQNRYPSPPARDLYFVANGKPQNEVVIEFLRWIVSSGQRFVDEAGYVQLSQEKLSEGLKKLKE